MRVLCLMSPFHYCFQVGRAGAASEVEKDDDDDDDDDWVLVDE